MLAYAYKVSINYNRLEKTSHRSVYIPHDEIDVEMLKNIVGDYKFTITNDDLNAGYDVVWYTKGFETDEEMNSRIKKLELYNYKVDSIKNGTMTISEALNLK